MDKKYTIPKFNQNTFLKDASDSLKTKVYAMTYKGGELRVYYSPALNAQEQAQLDVVVANHDGTPTSKLRIYRVLPEILEPLISDFTILGFRKISPSYERGRKTRAVYMCVEKDEIIVEKIFSDVFDENNNLTGTEITFNWYDEDGNIGLSKKELARSYNKYEAETEMRKRRERQIDYLVAGAKGTPIEPSLNAVFSKFYNEVMLYKDQGDAAPLGKALDSVKYTPNVIPGSVEETNNNLWAILNQVPLPRVDDPEKFIYVIQSIKYQIGLLTLEEIDSANS